MDKNFEDYHLNNNLIHEKKENNLESKNAYPELPYLQYTKFTVRLYSSSHKIIYKVQSKLLTKLMN